jgi:glycosyltransferase involved in cell wall biosynthesis
MHVLLIHQAFVSTSEAGGTRHFELAKHCVKRNCQFTVITSSISYLTGGKRKNISSIDKIKLKHAYTLPILHAGFKFRVFAFFSFMLSSFREAMISGSPDVVMGTTPPIFQAVTAWLVSKIRKRPFLLEVRDLWPEFAVDMGVLNNKFLIYLSRMLESFLYKKSDLLMVNSPAYRDYLLKKGISLLKIREVPNGVDSERFAVSHNDYSLRRKYNLSRKKLLVYTGALGMANDIYTLIDAMSILKKFDAIHLALVGDGKERLELERYVEKKDLKNITFIGAVPKSVIPAILDEADACVAILKNIHMFRTTYPNKVFDYMAAGKPTILVIDGVIREVIEKSKGGVFSQPGNIKKLADNIRFVLNNPVKSREMGQAAKKYVQKNFNREKQADDFYNILKEMACFKRSI